MIKIKIMFNEKPFDWDKMIEWEEPIEEDEGENVEQEKPVDFTKEDMKSVSWVVSNLLASNPELKRKLQYDAGYYVRENIWSIVDEEPGLSDSERRVKYKTLFAAYKEKLKNEIFKLIDEGALWS